MTIHRSDCGHIKLHWDIIKNVFIVLIVPGNLHAPRVAAGLIPPGNLQKREELTLPERDSCPTERSL